MYNTSLWLKSKHVVIPLKNLDAQIFLNCQFWAPRFSILAKTLIRNTGILAGMYPFFPVLELYKVNILHKEIM